MSRVAFTATVTTWLLLLASAWTPPGVLLGLLAAALLVIPGYVAAVNLQQLCESIGYDLPSATAGEIVLYGSLVAICVGVLAATAIGAARFRRGEERMALAAWACSVIPCCLARGSVREHMDMELTRVLSRSRARRSRCGLRSL